MKRRLRMSSTAERSLSMARPWVQDPAWLGREGGRELGRVGGWKEPPGSVAAAALALHKSVMRPADTGLLGIT